MIIDQQILRELINRPLKTYAPTELRREGNVFFLGVDLPVKETLETLFESHCQVPAELFFVSFGHIDGFHRGEELARQIKKNFSAHLVGRLDYPAPPFIIERAYAAGVDIIDIPLTIFDQALALERGLEKDARLAALEHARNVFPRNSVVSTLLAGEEPSCSTISGIDALLTAGIVPLVELSPRAAHYAGDEIKAVFHHLLMQWRKQKVTIKPLLPLVALTTPLVAARPKGMLQGVLGRIYDRQLLASSDLRRNLRVKRMEESFESAGL